MSNPFDNKLKESLEQFEMPYDANAWAELEKQLPKSGGASTNRFSWKAAALIAVLASSVATLLYLNSDTESTNSTEQTELVHEQSTIQESASEQKDEVIVAKKSNHTINASESEAVESEKMVPVVADQNPEAQKSDSENDAQLPIPLTASTDTKTVPTEKPTTPKPQIKPLVVNVIPSALQVCVGEDLSFLVTSSDPKAIMSWDFGDETSSREQNPSHRYVNQGDYSVVLKAENANQTTEQLVAITVKSKPMATLESIKRLDQFESIPLYDFNTTLQPRETAIWEFSDGAIVKGEKSSRLFTEAGKPSVKLTVTNISGCSTSEIWEEDSRDKFDILAPTIFTPDGNNDNETFMPATLPFIGIDFEFNVLDQKGQTVFRTNNPDERWNGKLNNTGEKLGPGTYIWTVVLKEDIAKKKVFNGTIILQR
ncbi:MAG: gliding motility-associated C-terminal domain-containing protein [Flavobacteriales bacterium]|nr:gliding motility-associated C-terminal domain-containing protein [Flavobacteriales bacterium]